MWWNSSLYCTINKYLIKVRIFQMVSFLMFPISNFSNKWAKCCIQNWPCTSGSILLSFLEWKIPSEIFYPLITSLFLCTKGSLKLKNVVVKAELFKEELKIEAKTKNGFSSEESTNCQFGSSNCQQVPSSAFPLYESEMNNTEIDLLFTAKFLFGCFKGGMGTGACPGSPLCLTDVSVFAEIPKVKNSLCIITVV